MRQTTLARQLTTTTAREKKKNADCSHLKRRGACVRVSSSLLTVTHRLALQRTCLFVTLFFFSIFTRAFVLPLINSYFPLALTSFCPPGGSTLRDTLFLTILTSSCLICTFPWRGPLLLLSKENNQTVFFFFMQQQWHVPASYTFDGVWSSQRIEGYALIVEDMKKRPDFSVQFSEKHRAYACPTCGVFFDRKIDTVTRHSLHCQHVAVAGHADHRGWWPCAYDAHECL